MKAIKELEKYKNSIIEDARAGGYLPCLDDVNEAITELKDIESYIEEQIKDCKQSGIDYGQSIAYADILQKIKGVR